MGFNFLIPISLQPDGVKKIRKSEFSAKTKFIWQIFMNTNLKRRKITRLNKNFMVLTSLCTEIFCESKQLKYFYEFCFWGLLNQKFNFFQ